MPRDLPYGHGHTAVTSREPALGPGVAGPVTLPARASTQRSALASPRRGRRGGAARAVARDGAGSPPVNPRAPPRPRCSKQADKSLVVDKPPSQAYALQLKAPAAPNRPATAAAAAPSAASAASRGCTAATGVTLHQRRASCFTSTGRAASPALGELLHQYWASCILSLQTAIRMPTVITSPHATLRRPAPPPTPGPPAPRRTRS